MLFLNSPSNPSGVAYSRAELEALGEVLQRHPQVIVGTDDMYEQILWADEPFCNLAMACPDLYDRVVILHGVSKAYAMTGWRIGYNVGPKPIMDAMAKIQSQSTTNACSVSQAAAEAALLGDQRCIEPMLKAFKERHDFVYQSFRELNSVSIVPADGAFYLFPNFQQIISDRQDLDNDIALAELLLNDAGVALVPGSAFGAEGCMRLSFATSMDVLSDAMARIKRVLS
jgi:aspartate aminotransferase